jgi:very-short-patch-repair endonuclease
LSKVSDLKEFANKNLDMGNDVVDLVDAQIKLWSEQQLQKKGKTLESLKSVLNKTLNGVKTKVSKAEDILAEALLEEKIPFKRKYPISPYENADGSRGARYYLDFLVDDSLNIEVDGEVWHDKKKDDIRDKYLEKLGYKVMRFPASQVYFDVNSIREKIREVLRYG